MSKVLQVGCEAGFSYVGENRVRILMSDADAATRASRREVFSGGRLADVDITEAAVQVWNAYYDQENYPGTSPMRFDPETREGVIEGAESFGLDDFAAFLEDWWKLEVYIYDGNEAV